jgi:class 3 adenylate cyclase
MAFDWKRLNDRADSLLEECARRQLGLKETFDRFLPAVSAALGARAARVVTVDENGETRAFDWGALAVPKLPSRAGVTRSGGMRWACRPLDVAGKKMGAAAFAFPPEAARDQELLSAVAVVCEQLDDVLFGVQQSALKQRLVERMGRSLTRSVFDQAIDDAVAAMREAVPFSRFALVYDDDEETAGGLRYRVYEGARCVYTTDGRRHARLQRFLDREQEAALEPGRADLAQAAGMPGALSCPLIAGVSRPRALGEALVECPTGVSAFGRDLLQIFANAVSQRLVDYNRERRHLSQFFSPATIDELVRDHDYGRLLSPRVAQIAMVYADINSFTKICEKVLRKPDRIGAFVDAFTGEAVRIVWKHGGLFDKMVGDCVISHFGPPFHRMSRKELAQAALSAAFEIQAFTAKLGRTEFKGIGEKAGLPGLGVAVGVNLCEAAVGLFGPNKDFTAFSSGMNQTARLQSQAGFRETLVMASVRDAAGASFARFEGPREASVKNVAKPLRYYKASPK